MPYRAPQQRTRTRGRTRAKGGYAARDYIIMCRQCSIVYLYLDRAAILTRIPALRWQAAAVAAAADAPATGRRRHYF